MASTPQSIGRAASRRRSQTAATDAVIAHAKNKLFLTVNKLDKAVVRDALEQVDDLGHLGVAALVAALRLATAGS